MFTMILVILSFLVLFKLFREFGNAKHTINNISQEDQKNIKVDIENIIKNINNNGKNVNLNKDVVIEDPLVKDINALQEKLSDFTSLSFLNKAEKMFDNIFNAFVNSHNHILKKMLTMSLYESFSNQIKIRGFDNFRQEIIIKHKKTKLEKIQLLANKAKLLVTFDVSQMSAIINSDGISFDNPKRLFRDVFHKWVFERNFEEENWILSKTSSAEL